MAEKFVNFDADKDAVSVSHHPGKGALETSNTSALTVRNQAVAGSGSALVVHSDNSTTTAVVVQGAGDLLDLRNAAGVSQFSVANSGNLTFSGTLTPDSLSLTGAATTTDMITADVTGDTQRRFILNANGTIEWGSGSGAVDTNLFRNSANVIGTNDAILNVSTAATDTAFSGQVTGDTFDRFRQRADGRIDIGPGSGARDTNIYRSAADILATDDDFAIKTAGKGLQVAEGSNAKMGVSAAMVAGTVTISTTAVTANSRIYLTPQTLGTVTRPAAVGVTARSAGTSFTITSSDATDTSTVAWMIVEPA